MSFGFPAYYQQKSSCLQTREKAFAEIKAVAASLGWRLTSETEDTLGFRVGINFWSWGENIKVAFHGKEVSVRSECRIYQCFDWGKNRANCQKIIQALTEMS